MASDMPKEVESYTASLIAVLCLKQGEIPWAANALNIYKMSQNVYSMFANAEVIPDPARLILMKIKELEKYMSINIGQHITLKNGNPPYYLERILAQVTKIFERCSCYNMSGKFDESPSALKTYDHIAAELQATFNEYGFCNTLEAIYDVDEATMKLDALSLKLSQIECQSNGVDPEITIETLHDVMATKNGIIQAMTEKNIHRMQKKFDYIDDRIANEGNKICSEHMKADSAVFLEYLGQQFLLRKPFVQCIFQSDSFQVVNDHMIHPGTRGWILERISRWLHSTEKRLYFIAGKQGTGKTALSTAICKLHNYDIIACHFFNSVKQDLMNNGMNGTIQAIASGMCRTMPEYVNWLDDKYGNADLQAKLGINWHESYNVLLKQPLQDLFGHGKSASPHAKRRLIVIDGVDEMNAPDLRNFKAFTSTFMKDIPSAFCIFVTIQSKHFSELIVSDEENVDGIRLEDRAWMNRHIKDIEIYLSSSLGAILSGEDEVDAPQHAKADDTTLQNTVDELLKCSSGRFDYAIQLMESFAREFGSTRQFLGSVKKATMPLQQSVGSEYDHQMSDFASPYRAYRDKEGRSVVVRVMRQSQYLMDKTRVALIRGRHKIHGLQN